MGAGHRLAALCTWLALHYSGLLRVRRTEVRDGALARRTWQWRLLSHPRRLPTRPVLGLPLPALVARGLVPGSFLSDGGLQGSPRCQPSPSFSWLVIHRQWPGPACEAATFLAPLLHLGFPSMFCKWLGALDAGRQGCDSSPGPWVGLWVSVSHPLGLTHCLQDLVPAD